MPDKALHLTAIPLGLGAPDELSRSRREFLRFSEALLNLAYLPWDETSTSMLLYI